MVTRNSHIFINIFQTVHFSSVKLNGGNEKNMIFLLIPKSLKVWEKSEVIGQGTFKVWELVFCWNFIFRSDINSKQLRYIYQSNSLSLSKCYMDYLHVNRIKSSTTIKLITMQILWPSSSLWKVCDPVTKELCNHFNGEYNNWEIPSKILCEICNNYSTNLS